MNSNITWKIIENNPDKPWDWRISRNPNITWEIIESNPDKPWNWDFISLNPNITWEIIQNNPTINWKWYGISRNLNITWEIIQSNPDKPWDWRGVSENPNIIPEIVKNNPDKRWYLSRNPMDQLYYTTEQYKQKLCTDFHSTIKEELIKVACHPKRVLWSMEYDDEHPCFELTQNEVNSMIGL